jgi:hypothetical protein
VSYADQAPSIFAVPSDYREPDRRNIKDDGDVESPVKMMKMTIVVGARKTSTNTLALRHYRSSAAGATVPECRSRLGGSTRSRWLEELIPCQHIPTLEWFDIRHVPASIAWALLSQFP